MQERHLIEVYMLGEKNLKFIGFFHALDLIGYFIFSIFYIPMIKDLIPNFTAIVLFIFRIILKCFLHVSPSECCQLLTLKDSAALLNTVLNPTEKIVLWTILFRFF